MTHVTTLRAADMKPINPNLSGPGTTSGFARNAWESKTCVWRVTEYECQTTRAQSEAQASRIPDTKAARRHRIDSAKGRFARQLAGKSDRNGPKRKIHISSRLIKASVEAALRRHWL